MRRRDFLKGIFGAAAIAAVPAIVLRQIDDLPPTPEKVDAIGNVYTGPVQPSSVKPIPQNGIFYIWDKDEGRLVGASTDFSLNMNANFVDVTSIDDSWPMYLRGLPSWNIEARNVQWLVNPQELFLRETKHLLCLMAKDDMKFTGDIYLSQISLMAEEIFSYDATFEGNGILEMIIQKG